MRKEIRKSSRRIEKVKRIVESLPVTLTDEERLQFADALAEANQAVEVAERNKKSAMQQHQSEIRLAEARRERLAGIVASKAEYRDVTVEERWDYNNDKYTRTRTDTGEVIFERRLTDQEKQVEMFELEESKPE